MPGPRTPKKTTRKTSKKTIKTSGKKPKNAMSGLVARVNSQVTLEVYANGKVGVYVDGYAIELGTARTVPGPLGLAKWPPRLSVEPRYE